MKMSWFVGIFLLLLFLSLSSSSFADRPSSSQKPKHPSERIIIGAKLKEYKPPAKRNCDIKVPSQFSTIQAAINSAENGNTICVGKGTYNEDLLVNKSIRLSGSGADKTTINGQGRTWPGTVYITAKDVTFEGFSINGVSASAAVQLAITDSPYDSTIQYNRIKSGYGAMALQLDGFQNTLAQNNIFEGNNSPHVVRESGGSFGRVDFLNNTFIGTVNPNERADTGITLDAGLPNGLIKRNVFNTTGTQIMLIAPNGTSILTENNFNSSVARKVVNGWPTTLNAVNNWWGDLDPSDNIQGDVDFTPFATHPFSQH